MPSSTDSADRYVKGYLTNKLLAIGLSNPVQRCLNRAPHQCRAKDPAFQTVQMVCTSDSYPMIHQPSGFLHRHKTQMKGHLPSTTPATRGIPPIKIDDPKCFKSVQMVMYKVCNQCECKYVRISLRIPLIQVIHNSKIQSVNESVSAMMNRRTGGAAPSLSLPWPPPSSGPIKHKKRHLPPTAAEKHI